MATGASSLLPQLNELDSPVPDFAATLTTQAEHENLNFLRTRSRYLAGGVSREAGRTRSTNDDVAGIPYVEGRSLRRSLLIRQRQREQDSRSYRDQAYGDRIPTYRPGQQQSVYDWAPASSDDEDDDEQFLPPHFDHDSVDELAGHHSVYANGSESSTGRAGTPPPPFYTPRTRTSSTSRIPELSSHNSQSSEPLLRNLAFMQSIRRHPRLSQRSRNQLQSYISERERSAHEGGRSTLRSSNMQMQSTSELRARVDAYRQRYLENSSGNSSAPSRWLEEAIKYLERLRFSSSYEDSLSSAAEGGLVRDEFLSVDHEDFVLDTASIDAPPESSWLKIGGVFEGSQYAVHDSHAFLHRLSGDLSPGSLTTTGGGTSQADPRILWASIHDPRTPIREDRWPVKVTIHSIDYNTMQLSGTMEAFNVPDWQSETGKSSIITYLEGEIIDFRTHSLETKNFPCTAEVDGTYWRKLEPFAGLDDSELVKTLVSKKWLTEQLSKNWVLMRWKGESGHCAGIYNCLLPLTGSQTEKCFITPSSHRSGLTISGFYYLSLRRSDGFIEGFYYDPTSSPYQQLTLKPEKRMFPTYNFR
ncbi:hypothetical protein FGG08_004193 [Glutinoglossum americanum]|uniref:Vacuolar import and degradation protein-domain-containing protein n=1 Tax=Glutinoglossum americanum TaxID=1670608 RepID=A0A9P8KZV1_9PEZI|nr:hypothetical protein FGG08_004193 [Glutinoglossum americanum]